MGGRLRGKGGFGSLTEPHRSGLEGGARVASVLAGTLLIGAGVLHISAAGDHTNLPVMTAGFLVVATLQAGLGGLLLLRRPGRLIVAGGVALTLGAIATWLISRTAGLPFLPGGHMEPVGFKDGVTVLFELATVPVLALLASSELDRVQLPSPRLGTRTVAFMSSAMFALFVPALVLGGGEHHSADEMAGHAHGDDGHGDEPDELASVDSHLHDGDSTSGGGGHERADGEDGHAHGRPATPETFAKAHKSATGHSHTAGEHATNEGSDGHDSDGDGHDHGNNDDSGGHDEGDKNHADGHDGGDNHGSGGHDRGDNQHARGHRDGDNHGSGDDHGDDEHAGHGGGSSPDRDRSIAIESGHAAGNGRREQGPAVVYHDWADEKTNGPGHAHAGTCNPTPEQQSAADKIVAEVRAELMPYRNNPAAAIADGFDYIFGPTDRMLHVVAVDRVSDPDVMVAPEIESFIYYMTDTGFVPIGGMFIMPQGSTSGPEPGGCLTQWHQHGGAVGRWATAGTSETTPLMMHVFTYPGLDPWGHYTGRDLASLWTPGRFVPSLCRSADDANNGCLP